MPNEHDKIDSKKVIGSLNTILELELAGVVRYLHYSLMVFGHARIPIIGWMRNQATEGMVWSPVISDPTAARRTRDPEPISSRSSTGGSRSRRCKST